MRGNIESLERKWKPCATRRDISTKGIELIKKHEGLKLEPYYCSSGKLTVGYGHRTSSNKLISTQEADKLLLQDLKKAIKVANKYSFNQAEFDAVVSFIYNIGITAFSESTFSKTLKIDELEKWVYSGGKKRNGLIKRRNEEINLYNDWVYAHFYDWILYWEVQSGKRNQICERETNPWICFPT